MPDPIFADPRLAALYDIVDDDRSDLDVYFGIVNELNASSVLDIGCGTGTLACMLASRKVDVVGLDPARRRSTSPDGSPGQSGCGGFMAMPAARHRSGSISL